jgi:hypothetical protein
MLAGGKRKKEGKGEIHSPLYPCTRIPEWNSLCWLVESEGEEKEKRKVALSERENKSFRDMQSVLLIP